MYAARRPRVKGLFEGAPGAIGNSMFWNSLYAPSDDLHSRGRLGCRIKGSFHEVKGKVKDTVGKVTNNADLKVEGKAEHEVFEK